MPRIKEYLSQVDAPGPTNQRMLNADDFGAAAWEGADKAAQGGQMLGDAFYQSQKISEMTDGARMHSEKQIKNREWLDNQIKNADPKDASKINFYGEAEKYVEQQYNGDDAPQFQTKEARAYYEKLGIEEKENVMGIAMKAQSELRGQATVNNLKDVVNAKALLISKSVNPGEMLQAEIPKMKELIAAAMPMMGKQKAYELEQSVGVLLGQAFVKGSVTNNTVEAIANLKGNQWDHLFKSIEEKEDMLKYAQAYQSAKNSEIIQAHSVENILQDKKNEDAKNKWIHGIWGGGKAPTAAEIDASDADAATKITAIGWLKAKQNEPPRSKKGAKDEAFLRILDGEILSIEQFTDEYLRTQKLTTADYQGLVPWLEGLKTEEGRTRNRQIKDQLKTWKKTVTGDLGLGIVNPQWADVWEDKMNFFRQETERVKKEGLPWTVLFDKNDKNYFGKHIHPPTAEEVSASYKKAAEAYRTGNAIDESEAPGPEGFTELMDIYNKMLPQSKNYNGKPTQRFGADGQLPQSGVDFELFKRAEEALKPREAERARIKAEQEARYSQDVQKSAKFIEQQNYVAKKLGYKTTQEKSEEPIGKKIDVKSALAGKVLPNLNKK